MDSKVKLYFERAENEMIIGKINFDISTDISIKKMLHIEEDRTFFNDVISQCYYSIFYAAKAYIISNNVETKPPEEHKKTYDEFSRLVASGKLDRQLLDIYTSEKEKAEVLMGIFKLEKSKRGRFTYNMNANANIPYAKESLENARLFVSLIKAILEKEDKTLK